MRRIEMQENTIQLVWEITDTNEIKLLHFSALEFEEENMISDTGTQSFIQWKFWYLARTESERDMDISIYRHLLDIG